MGQAGRGGVLSVCCMEREGEWVSVEPVAKLPLLQGNPEVVVNLGVQRIRERTSVSINKLSASD